MERQTMCMHVVRWGETLATLARTYYDDPQLAGEIWKANRALIPNVNMIYPGQVLTIPHLPDTVASVTVVS